MGRNILLPQWVVRKMGTPPTPSEQGLCRPSKAALGPTRQRRGWHQPSWFCSASLRVYPAGRGLSWDVEKGLNLLLCRPAKSSARPLCQGSCQRWANPQTGLVCSDPVKGNGNREPNSPWEIFSGSSPTLVPGQTKKRITI